MVGGTVRFLMAMMVVTSSTTAAGPRRWPADRGLGAADGDLAGVIAEDLLDGLGLGNVAQGGAGTVSVD